MAEAWSQRRRGVWLHFDNWQRYMKKNLFHLIGWEKCCFTNTTYKKDKTKQKLRGSVQKKSRKPIFILDDRCLNRKHNDICKVWMNHFCMWLAHFAFCVTRKSYLKFIFHVFHLWVITWFFSCNFDKISTRIFFSNALNRTFPFDSRYFVILWKTLLCFFTQNHVITCTKTTKKYRVECEKGNKHGCHSTSVKLIITLLHFNLFILI